MKSLPSYLMTLGSLGVIFAIRNKIGQNLFMPWGKTYNDSFTRIALRFWMVILLFLWVRAFFVFDAIRMEHPILNEPWFLFLGFTLNYGFSMDLLLYYYSYVVVIFGIAHIIAIEVHYAKKESIPRKYLGDSILFNWLKARMGVENETIWTFFDPLVIAGCGLSLQLVFNLVFAGVFFEIAAIFMALQGYGEINKGKESKWDRDDTNSLSERNKRVNKGFKENREKKRQAAKHNDDDEGASLA